MLYKVSSTFVGHGPASTDALSQAKENVRKAIEIKNPGERQSLLSEALRYVSRLQGPHTSLRCGSRRLYTHGARILSLEKLREICGDFQQLEYAKG
jgi:nuclear pore complex protein Nup155